MICIQIVVFWFVTPCSLVDRYRFQDGDSIVACGAVSRFEAALGIKKECAPQSVGIEPRPYRKPDF